MNFQISGSTAFVTGANRGIGRALVKALLHRGAAKVYAAARRPESVADLVAASGGRVVPVRLDITTPEQIRAAAAAATDVTLLVNNAGVVGQFGADFTNPGWITAGREEFEVNVLGTFAMTQAFAPILAANGGGAVANLSSVAGLVAFGVLTSYSASKAALHSLTQATRTLLRSQGTFVAGVYPGPIETEMSKPLQAEKTSPETAAEAILEGLDAGNEEIFPDPTARQIGELFLRDPKGLERQTAGSPVEAAATVETR
jgi:NAD(P)-dependent dehydrogenase (short-subunit alcohol dehydrogenase family)